MRPETDTASPPATLKDKAKGRLGDAKRTVREEAASFAATAKQKAAGEIEQRQHAMTGTVTDFADAIRRAGDELTERDQTMAAQVVRQAADSLEDLARNLDGKTPGDMLNSARDFGRRHPVAFIGGTVLLGLAVGRFIRSSGSDDLDETYSAQTGAEWGDETMMPGATGTAGAGLGVTGAETAGLDANAQAFDADTADTTMTPEGAGAAGRRLDGAGTTLSDVPTADDQFGASSGTGPAGSPTRGS